MILEELRKRWVPSRHYAKADYYRGFNNFCDKYQWPLRVFSLNYDLCIEKVCGRDAKIERGFGDERNWHWKNFEDAPEANPVMFLYKLHGSLDWEREQNSGLITLSDEPSAIEDYNNAIIFGLTHKTQYIDPYLFLAYEFRRWTLEAKLIIIIGYSFGDDHINGIIKQALVRDKNCKVLIVSPGAQQDLEKTCVNLGISVEQVATAPHGARKFLTDVLSVEYIEDIIGEAADNPDAPF